MTMFQTKPFGGCKNGDSREAARDFIVSAALARFAHYGYAKTTITDIASACQMSPGNIYRYFENKLEIAVTIVQQITRENIQKLEEHVQRADKSAKDQLRIFLFENLRLTFQHLEDKPRLIEMGHYVVRHRPHLRLEELEGEHKILARILERGDEEGIFQVDCPESAAHIIQCAAVRFHYPHLTKPHANLDQLEGELEGLYGLILSGLKAGCSAQIDSRGHVFPEPPKRSASRGF